MSQVDSAIETMNNDFNALNDDQVTEVIRVASVESFQIVAFIPLILLPIFGLLWARENAKAAVNE